MTSTVSRAAGTAAQVDLGHGHWDLPQPGNRADGHAAHRRPGHFCATAHLVRARCRRSRCGGTATTDATGSAAARSLVLTTGNPLAMWMCCRDRAGRLRKVRRDGTLRGSRSRVCANPPPTLTLAQFFVGPTASQYLARDGAYDDLNMPLREALRHRLEVTLALNALDRRKQP